MWFIIICLTTIAAIMILNSWRRPSKFPPGPTGLPIVGNILDVKRLLNETKFFSHTWCRLANIYGPVVGLKLGISKPLIIISGRDAVTEMLNRSEFDGRSKEFLFLHRTGGVPRGIVFTEGDMWRQQKRFTLKTLKDFGFGKLTMENMILNNAVALTNIIESQAKSGPITNLEYNISIAVFNVLWTLLAGSKFDLNKDNAELTKTLNVINELLKTNNVTGGILSQFPFLRYIIPELIGFTALNQRFKQVFQFCSDVIAEHKRTRTKNKFRDFIDVYLAEMDNVQSSSTVSYFDEMQLIYVIEDLLIAGIDTTKNRVSFVITYLVMKQNVQKKVQEEIDRTLGKEVVPRIEHKNRLSYLNATIAEVLRLTSAVTMPHRALTDTILLDYEIKKDYTLLGNLKSVHMDEKHWGDPKEFRPERFINNKGEYFEDPWLMSFGLGHRKCLGENLARNNVFLFTACLLQKFHFALAPECPEPNLDGIDGIIIKPPNISIIATKRA